MGKLIEETKQELSDLSDEHSWARTLRRRYRVIMKTNPELADEYDVTDAQEILAEYLFPIQPSIHINWLVKTISFLSLILIISIMSILLAGLLIHIIFPDAQNTVRNILVIGSVLAVGIPVIITYTNQRESTHSCIIKRRVKKIRKWLAKTRV